MLRYNLTELAVRWFWNLRIFKTEEQKTADLLELSLLK